MTDIDGLLLIPHLRVQNANAISGPLSWGFPSPTAFLGFAHALERKLRDDWEVQFTGVAIVCHRFDPLTTQPNRRRHQVFNLMRHPVRAGYKKWQDKDAALIEEGRAHMEISLLLETEGDFDDEPDEFLEMVSETVQGMRLAGGSILPMRDSTNRPVWQPWWDDESDNLEAFRKLRRRLLPGFALVHRPDLLAERLDELREQNPDANALDALIDLSALHVEPATDEQGQAHWQYHRPPGWIVPLPIGYSGLSELYPPGQVAHARDGETPFRFVESLYSLGQWISPHRIHHPGHLMWRYQTDEPNGLYLCANDYATTLNKE
ncbi:MAG TPA: type I-F CRISPR-associated protein Csy2 [Thiolapillus brandeum]|uniref:Type I-F CRISPR-associated protein Csy2 n=1 Tax=Thiolapillus brandeum TaxID=1076588 RepID=A0A831RRW4_9GAMM|nr:type I-F CRISPR-associated protein Csy2 [Thiolapillus brandeum]